MNDTLWQAVGGADTFSKLAHEFYARVRKDEILAPMYPDDDWEGAERRLRMFLEQYWGGPKNYSAERGHPRLRMRHQPFPVTRDAARRWLTHMHAALDSVNMPELYDTAFRDYIDRAAASLINRRDDARTQLPLL